MLPHDKKLDWSKSFMYSIHQTYFLVQKRLEQKLLKVANISFSQFLILLPLHCKDKASQADIAEFLHLTEATVSRHINGLVKEGIISRKEDPNNRRKHILTLTAKGTKDFVDAHKKIETELAEIFKVIPEKHRTLMTRSFDDVLKILLSK